MLFGMMLLMTYVWVVKGLYEMCEYIWTVETIRKGVEIDDIITAGLSEVAMLPDGSPLQPG